MNTSTKRIENNKNFDKELSLIERLNSLNCHDIKIAGDENVKACISKSEETFNLEIDVRLIEESEGNSQLAFILDKDTYEIKRLGNSFPKAENISIPKVFTMDFRITLYLHHIY